LSHGYLTTAVDAMANQTDGSTGDRARELLIMSLCNLTSHGPMFKDEICKIRRFPAVLTKCVLSEHAGVSDYAVKLFNALCCHNTALALERVDILADGGLPAALAALFHDDRQNAMQCAVKVVRLPPCDIGLKTCST
jgi:hypothetical protein